MSDGSRPEIEAANLLLPLQNSNGVRAYYGGVAGPTTQVIGLPTYFGNWSEHFYTIAADGGKLYAALSRSPTGMIDPGAIISNPTPTCNGFPIPDGAESHGFCIGGRPVGATGSSPTGPVTATFLSHDYLLIRTASGVGSAFFHIRRSSVGRGAGVEEFFPPGYKRGHYQR